MGNDKSNKTVIYTSKGEPQDLWNYGKEAWCNLEGRYTQFVFDLTDRSHESYTISICNLGIFGTKYVRNVQIPT